MMSHDLHRFKKTCFNDVKITEHFKTSIYIFPNITTKSGKTLFFKKKKRKIEKLI